MLAVRLDRVPGGTLVQLEGDLRDPSVARRLADALRGLAADGSVTVELGHAGALSPPAIEELIACLDDQVRTGTVRVVCSGGRGQGLRPPAAPGAVPA